MRGFIEELRHRNVIRVGLAYIIVAWLFAQVADLAADAFTAPEWFMQMLIVVLLLGLPVALFLAWAFELTPDGVVKTDKSIAVLPFAETSARVATRPGSPMASPMKFSMRLLAHATCALHRAPRLSAFAALTSTYRRSQSS